MGPDRVFFLEMACFPAMAVVLWKVEYVFLAGWEGGGLLTADPPAPLHLFLPVANMSDACLFVECFLVSVFRVCLVFIESLC